jgi:hypothetical protein
LMLCFSKARISKRSITKRAKQEAEKDPELRDEDRVSIRGITRSEARCEQFADLGLRVDVHDDLEHLVTTN